MTDRIVLEVLSATDTRATVRLSGWDYYAYKTGRWEIDDDKYLDFEFELIDGVWKISGGNFIDRLDAVYAA